MIESSDPAGATYKGTPLRIDDGQRYVHALFGPTISPVQHPTHIDEQLTTYANGVAFSFKGSKLVRVIITPGTKRAMGADVFSTALKSPILLSDGFVDSVVITLGAPTTTLVLSIAASADEPKRDVTVELGETTAEDIACELGPAQIFYKQDDRFLSTPGSYFYAYFSHGIDFMLDSNHHVAKVVLHSNLLGGDLFGRYARCPWVLETRTGSTIRWCDSIDSAAAALPGKKEAPLILDRSADSQDPLVIGKQTELHGFPGLVLEATTDSGAIETLWLV